MPRWDGGGATRPARPDIEIINIRVALTAAVVSEELRVPAGRAGGVPAPKARRAAWSGSEGRFVDTPVYDRYVLGVGAGVEGPSIIEEASSTLRREVEGREVTVTLDRAAGERDRYGRLLDYLESNGTDVGELLISRGLARVYTAESFRAERALPPGAGACHAGAHRALERYDPCTSRA